MHKAAELSFPEQALRDVLRQTPGLAEINEPGFASTFTNPTVATTLYNYSPLIPLGSAAAGLWYLNRSRKRKQKPQPARTQEKQALDWRELLSNIRHHAPKARLPDTVAGMLAGGAAGGLYDLIRGRDKATGRRRTGKRMLTGALLGAGLSNLVGDRARRYISNTLIPVGNDPDAMQSLKPTPQRIWNAAILDKTDYRPQDMESFAPSATMIPARQELLRRQFGLPIHDPKNPWWQKNPGGHYSLNEKSPDYVQRLQTLFGKWGVNATTNATKNLFKNPTKALKTYNQNPDDQPQTDLFGSRQVVGGQLIPHLQRDDGTVQGMVLDRWDQTPSAPERDFLRNNWWKALTDSTWRKSKLSRPLSWYLNTNHTNADAAKILAGRMVFDNVLSDELPWVSQKFEFTPNAKPWIARDYGESPYRFSFLRDSGDQATPPMGFNEFKNWNVLQPVGRALNDAWRNEIKAKTPPAPALTQN